MWRAIPVSGPVGVGRRTSSRGRCGLAWLVLMIVVSQTAPASVGEPVTVHFFWSVTCPHCRDMAEMLEAASREDAGLAVYRHEVSRDPDAAAAYARTVQALDLPAVVPIVLVGDQAMVGVEPDAAGRLRGMIARCRAGPCPDPVLGAGPSKGTGASAASVSRQDAPRSVQLPWIGERRLAEMSLPLLTVVMAAIDGFNPCAMWVLVFLVGLLLGISDRRRMWLLAGTFLFATAAVYFLFLAAWLNVLWVLGAARWLRVGIGVLAIGAGGLYLREGLRREQVCEVTQPERRRRIFDRLRRLVQEPSLSMSMLGVALLAVAVNVVELLCSAGIPAVYTGILSQAQLPGMQYYAYLLLYVLVFLADDTALVVLAMTTLRVVQADGGYGRWVRLAGGVVMLALGAALILRPEWLSFG
jgi:thiol-disulfide isomerase/thioredoxin